MASVSEASESLQDVLLEALYPPKNDSIIQEETQSSILELQQALGPLLLARKHKCTCLTQHRKLPFIPSHGCPDTLPLHEPIKPQWTGAFQLFSFPRELREKIFFHYLHRPQGYTWARYSAPRHFSPSQHPAVDVTRLLLTSRQVYAEARDVFCRYSTVYLSRDPRATYGKRLDDILRHFPYRPSRALQCVGNVYWSDSTWGNEKGAPDSFLQILRDAHEMKAQFPRLRVFKVRYGVQHLSDAEALLVDCKWSDERKVAKMLHWMRSVVAGSNVVPPAWVRWELFGQWQEVGRCDEWGREIGPCVERDQSSMNKAYRLLVREWSGVDDLEESGRKWIEEARRLEGRRGPRKT
ncbi:hypothetical protein J1614_006622 [Plenodomus biglobosus]|nr:hypothetical protein J1614_006622 [Plenodomus biglobosus]